MLPYRAIYFFVVVILTLIGLVWGLIDTRRVIEAPFLYATGMALILCPQLYVAASDAVRVPDEAYWVYNLMVILCTAALYIGYFSQPGQRVNKKRPGQIRPINHVRLYQLGIAAALTGTFGAYKLSTLGTITEWRGWPVYWVSLATFIVPGVILMLVAYANIPSLARLLPIILLSIIPATWVMDHGRRASALTYPLLYAMPFLIYKKNLRIPRWLILVGFALAFIVVYAFPVWRNSFSAHEYLQAIRDNPLSEVMEDTFTPDNGKVLEITDGMIVTGARYELGNYEWGVVALYNQIIQNYVPGSLIGYDLKDSMRIGQGVSQNWVTEVYGIPVASYTAKSGYEDLFSQFSFLGCIVMYFIGMGFRRVHDAAVGGRDGKAVIFMCFFISFPAGLAYGALTTAVVLQVPLVCLMFIAFRLCILRSKVPKRFYNPALIFAPVRIRRILSRQGGYR